MGRRTRAARRVPWPGLCPRCNYRQEWSDRFDATLCPRCDEWRESACGASECEFCKDRPSRPSLARELQPDDPALRRAARLAATVTRIDGRLRRAGERVKGER